MERDGEQLSARPALESEGLRFLHVTVGSLLAAYGWYLVFGCVLLFAAFQKLSARLRASRQRRPDPAAAAVAPEDVVRRQEALAAARLKMQEELNAQVERHKEKLRQAFVPERQSGPADAHSSPLHPPHSLRKRNGEGRLKCGTACKRGKATEAMPGSLRKKTTPALLLHPASPNGQPTGSPYVGVVITLCLGKEEEPARGDLDAEAHHLGDEAKKALPVSLDTKQASPHPQPPSIALRTLSHSDQPSPGAWGSLLSSTCTAPTRHQRVPISEGGT
ncbi:selenoprotein S isoform X1 [Myotis myotis]|uniref:selenoprotein S isoform X1 n=1 Tax=Myotis myotis TaxID=51298 RepID=UPI00174B8F76|nr:selenoprotein S isoform X1 [Myotis myotis]